MRIASIAWVGLLVGCQGAGMQRAPELPSTAAPCRTETTADTCAALVADAAQRGDRNQVGQLLTAAASWLPADQQLPVARAGAWLNPRAWAADDVARLLDQHPPPAAAKTKKGGVLALGVEVDAKDVHHVALDVPPGQGPWAGRNLAVTLALATGSDAAAWQQGPAPRLAAASPLLDRISATPVAFEPSSHAAAVATGAADGLLRQGRRTEAYVALGRAIEKLPQGAAPCRTRGVLHYLRWSLAGAAYAGTGNDHYEELRDICLASDEAGTDPITRDYLRELSALQLHRGSEVFALPAEWISDTSRTAYAARIDSLGKRLSAEQRALLKAMRDEMLARTLEPEGPCDTGFTERWKDAIEQSRERLASLGRLDLARPYLRTKMAGSDGITVEGVDELMAWADRPAHRWMRLPTLTGALVSAEYASPSEKTAALLAPVCSAAHAGILADIERDEAPGHASRDVVRMLALYRGAAVCGPPDAFGDVADLVLAKAARGPDGKLGVWRTTGYAAMVIAHAALEKRIAQALMSGHLLRGALRRLQSGLGQSDEDVVLDASLTLVLGSLDAMLSERGDHARRIDGVVRRVAPVVERSNRPGAPRLVRYAPVVHLAALALGVAVEAEGGNPDRLALALSRLEKATKPDVTRFMEAEGEARYTRSVVRLMRSLAASGRALSDPKRVPGALKEARQAAEPGPDERRYWSVGLNLVRVVALDFAAYAAMRAEARFDREAILRETDEAWERLAEHALRDFAEKGSGLEVLHLLPALHRGVLAGLTAEGEEVDRMDAALDAAGQGARSALVRMNLEDKQPGEIGFLAVLVDALRLAGAHGGPGRLVDDPAARRAWADALAERSDRYPPELSLIAQITSGAAAYEAAPEQARERFRKAAETASRANPRNVPYLSTLVEAAVMHHAGDTAGAAQAVDRILSHGTEARSCRAPHEVDALLPYRAWAAERLGRHDEADAALGTYLERLDTFSGLGKLHCRIGSYRPTIVFTADVTQHFDRLFFRGEKATGSLQSGLGFGDPRNEDRLVCTASPILGKRPDIALVTHLTRAVYAFRTQDEGAAHQALGDAVETARLLMHGDDVTVGMGERLLLDLAKSEAQLGPVVWGAIVARAHGHIAAADALDRYVRVASAVERDLGLAEILRTDPEPPSAFSELGFDALGPWVREAWDAKVEGDDKALRSTPAGGAIDSWQGSLIRAQLDRSHAQRLGRMRTGTALRAALRDRVQARIDRGAGKPARPLSLAGLQALADAGLHLELVDAVLVAVSHALLAKDEKTAGKLVDLALASVPADGASLARADLLIGLRARWPQRMAPVRWARDLAAVHAALQGRVPAPAEVETLHAAASILGREGQHAHAQAMLDRLHVLMQRALGDEHPRTLIFAVASLANRAVQGADIQTEAKALLAVTRKAPRLEPAVASLVDALAQGDARGADAAERFLRSLPPL